MNVAYINPIISAVFSVVEITLGEAPKVGELAVQPNVFTSQKYNIVVGVTGQLQGNIIFGMSNVTALRIASAMLGQQEKMFSQLVASAIAELSNMISGNAMQHLCEIGFICDITPPSLINGEAEISTISVPALVVPVESSCGTLFITVGLKPRK